MARCDEEIAHAVRHTREHVEDPPEIRDWAWQDR